MFQKTNLAVRDFVRSIPLFSGLPDGDVEALMKSAQLRSYKKGEYLYRQGEGADRLNLIAGGWVRVYRSNYDGEEGAVQLYTKGDILGERAILPGELKHFFSAQVVGDTKVVNFPGPAAREIIKDNPVILNKMMLMLVDRMGHIHVGNEHMALLSAPQRVACLILRLSQHMAGKGGTFTFPYDKSLAAIQLGMKRETFSRALLCLKRYGVSCNGSEITIENFIRLSEFSCIRCSLNTECGGARCMECPFGKTKEICASIL